MSFIKNVFITVTSKFFILIMSTIINIMIARMLGPTGKGICTLVLLVSSTLFTFGNLGITSSVVYFVGKKKYSLKQIVSNVWVIGLIIGIALSLTTIVVVNNFYIPFLKGIPVLYTNIIVLALPILFIGSYLSSILLGKQKIWLFNLKEIIERFSFLLIFLLLLLIPNAEIIINTLIAFISSSVISCILVIVFVSKMTEIGILLQYNFFSDVTKYGLRVYFSNLMLFSEKKMDIFFVNFFLNSAMVGYYSLATGLAEFLMHVPKSVSVVLFPKIASISKIDAKDYTPKVCRHVLFITILSCIMLGLCSSTIIKVVYGNAFIPAIPVVWVFLPGMVFSACSRVILSDLMGRGKPKYSSIASFTGTCSSIGLNFLLIPIYGMIGAAIASVLSYFLMMVVLLVFYLRISGNKLIDMVKFDRDDLMLYVMIIKKMIHRIKLMFYAQKLDIK
ncbi:MAG: oligosaccharide flippase family protein [Candidatus Desantisbacteria bacterium]